MDVILKKRQLIVFLDDKDDKGDFIQVNNIINNYHYEETFFKPEDYAVLLKSYIKKLKKIARKLKELERRGIRLDSKWAKIKAYATQSSVAPVSAASSSLQHSQPILSDSK